MKSNLIDIEVFFHVTTAKAVMVSDTGEAKDAVWLPLSQIEQEPPENGLAGYGTVTLPEWLALERGLI